MTELLSSPELGPIGQIILGLATLVNSLFLWPVVKKLQHNDERQDARLSHLEGPPKPRRRKKARK